MKRKKHDNTVPRAKKTKKLSIFISVPLILISFFVISVTIYKISKFLLTSLNSSPDFPKIEIFLSEVSLEEIHAEPKDIKYPGNTVIFTTNNHPTTFENVEIKGRGNANWNQYKKPYQIKFSDKVSLFNLAASKKWILIGNYIDRSYLRTDIAYYLERMLTENYALNGNFAELYIDDVYQGLYYISEKIEIKKSRINLQDDYGIIVELDNLHADDNTCHYTAINKHCITVHDIVNQDNLASATDNILETLSQLESTVSQNDFTKISDLIDVDSFVKYFLLSEFTVNSDAYSSSLFFYKDGKNDKLHVGPGWDFDFSLANTLWGSDGLDRESFFSPSTDTALKDYHTSFKQDPTKSHANSITTLFYNLIDLPEFKARVKTVYQETLSGKKTELLNYIKNQANYIREAALRDAKRWKLQENFDDEVNHLIDWISQRYDHFETTYGQISTEEPPVTQDV